MNTWFRFYSGSISVPKIQNLSGNLFKSWVNLLCIASSNNSNRGALPQLSDICYRLRLPKCRVEVILNKLIEVGLIDRVDGHYRMHDWKDWQYDSDNSTHRVQQFRKRQRNVSETPIETDREEKRRVGEGEHSTHLETSTSKSAHASLLTQAADDERERIAENAEPWTAEIPLPLDSGDAFLVPGALYAEWKTLFPAINVLQELRQMRAWLLANPTHRKTERGMPRFCTAWLSRSQSHVKPNGRPPACSCGKHLSAEEHQREYDAAVAHETERQKGWWK